MAIGSGRNANDLSENTPHMCLVIEAALDGDFTEWHSGGEQRAHNMTNSFLPDRFSHR
jgi:hypothetical protein